MTECATKNIAMAEIKLTEAEVDAATAVLRSGALRQGRQCEAFEHEFAEKVGAKYAVTCANGSASLHLAYMTFLKPGDEVLVPSFTFIATGSMVMMAGGKPVMCDVDPETFLIDLEDAASRITEKTVAISPVHLFGNVCNINAIQAFAKKHHLKIVWDNAQCHGATYQGKDVGGFDDFTSYSFYPSKNMFVGEGGMILTNDEESANKLRYLRMHGQTGKYYHTMAGLNYRMTDVEAAIGREQLKRLDEMLATRRRSFDLYNQAFSTIDGITVQKTLPNTEHAVHQYCMVIDQTKTGISRDDLMARLKEEGIATGIHYPRGMHQQPVFIDRYGEQTLPITEKLSQRIMALPIHHGMAAEDAEYVVASVQDILKSV